MAVTGFNLLIASTEAFFFYRDVDDVIAVIKVLCIMAAVIAITIWFAIRFILARSFTVGIGQDHEVFLRRIAPLQGAPLTRRYSLMCVGTSGRLVEPRTMSREGVVQQVFLTRDLATLRTALNSRGDSMESFLSLEFTVKDTGELHKFMQALLRWFGIHAATITHQNIPPWTDDALISCVEQVGDGIFTYQARLSYGVYHVAMLVRSVRSTGLHLATVLMVPDSH